MTAIEIARECGATFGFQKTPGRGQEPYMFATESQLSTFVQRIKDEAYEEAAKACQLVRIERYRVDEVAHVLVVSQCAAAIRSLKSTVGGESTGVRT